ncbi:DUF6567 family protein [Aureibacter tunicatorum]|uniref:Uncharacterized protein n=1 Tax=Aureibacter tunicatorum TaxID=866807 RepID=A0AAE3XUF9_9BACT|nr:DUF6567 family protein [Aureibacter tunicatorum]MDR6242101.1 hypothetical protein [Aureibacter tunicatorum]BDD05635.1 hypothetical protein AUTU_31180 [Aureibacter tunicatorum]
MLRKSILLLAISAGLSSCAFHMGGLTGNASLGNNNFQVVDFAIGTANTTQVLGIGGLKKDGLVLEAKRNLYANRPLKKGQALANVTVDFKRSYYFLVSTTEVTVTAEVVDFNDVKDTMNKENIDMMMNGENHSDQSFNMNEQIYVSASIKDSDISDLIIARVIDFKGTNRLQVQFESNEGELVTRKVSKNFIFKIEENDANKESFGFNIGDRVKYFSNSYAEPVIGKVIGLNSERLLIHYYDDENKKERKKIVQKKRTKLF